MTVSVKAHNSGKDMKQNKGFINEEYLLTCMYNDYASSYLCSVYNMFRNDKTVNTAKPEKEMCVCHSRILAWRRGGLGQGHSVPVD